MPFLEALLAAQLQRGLEARRYVRIYEQLVGLVPGLPGLL